MDKLWAPWRISYISGKKKKGCIFCQAAKGGRDHVVFRSKHAIVMLNAFPYNNGHLMVAPLRHVRDTAQLKDAETIDLFRALNTAKSLLKKTIKPHGFNIGMNLERSAGAGITGHLHIHIVPRWIGDTNFMPVTGATKVISQSLKELHRQLTDAYARAD
jgi:ATP adenylyltransferase